MLKVLTWEPINETIIHHTGGLLNDPYASTLHHTAEDVDRAHRARFGFISTLGRWGGYTAFIDQTGLITQFRAIGEELAANKGRNLDTVAICLAGNFDGVSPDMPTPEQVNTLKKLLTWIYSQKQMMILPHRLIGQTNCYGSKLGDNWAWNLFRTESPEKDLEDAVRRKLLKEIVGLYQQILGFLRNKTFLGGKPYDYLHDQS